MSIFRLLAIVLLLCLMTTGCGLLNDPCSANPGGDECARYNQEVANLAEAFHNGLVAYAHARQQTYYNNLMLMNMMNQPRRSIYYIYSPEGGDPYTIVQPY